MLIRSRSLDDSVIALDLHGELSVKSSTALGQAVSALVRGGRRDVLLNMSGVSTLDAAGLGELVRVFTTLQSIGGQLKLVIPSPTVRELLARTKLLCVFATYPTEAAARASFSAALPC